ncbi:MAG TPA: TonB-dependent receptor [Bryobacteraceae bacterium]|nr:TonB-dependent receptor [Bryobacteraceae bacterium]
MRHNSVLVRFAASLLALAPCCAPLSAQVLYGSIVGAVEDPSGATIPRTTITLTSSDTGLTREVQPDQQGRYSILSVLPGSYSLKFTAQGFRTLTRTGIEVSANTVTRVDVRLEVGQVAEQITITAEALALQTDKSETRSEIATSAITSLPLPNFRNYQSLINLVPGATPGEFQNTYMSAPGRALRTNVNGANPNNNNTRVDGATNIFIWLPHHTAYVPPSESIETVAISTSSFDAEQGMAGGAAVTVVTKSGTNDLHGVAFWFHDNQHLKARNYNYRPTARPVLPKTINNIAGGTLGGPIKKNKLFYFFSYERTMQRNGVAGNFSVPPADMRTGDFSKYLGLTTIYDPLTGNPDGSGRTPFAGNIVPRERISPIIANIQKLAPLPNQASDDIWGLSNNYGVSGSQKLDRDQYDFKTNYNPTSKLAIWGKYSRTGAGVSGKAAFEELVGPGVGGADPGHGTTTVQVPTAGFVYTVSPTFLFDGVYGYTRLDQPAFGFDYGKNYGSEIWKIPGTNGGAQYANDEKYSGMPAIYTGFTGWGQLSTPLPWWRWERSQTYSTNFSKINRGHELRFGFDMVHHALTHWQPETANPRGEINFSGNTTMVRGGTARTPNTYAAALLGFVASYNKSIQYLMMETREWQFGWYLRDRWQVSKRLTLNLGLRYEYYPLMTRGDRGVERWDPQTNLVTIGGLGGIPKNNGITTSKKLFAPRLGFAFRMNNETVIRAGYGITYDPLPFSRPLRGLYPSTITASFVPVTVSGYEYYNSIAEGLPPVPTPDISRGSIPLPATIDMGPRSAWAGEIHRGYIQSWNFTIERQLPYAIVASVGYVGNHTVHWLADRDINAAGPGAGNVGRPLYAKWGRAITTNMWDGFADGHYHGLQTSLNRALAGGLLLKGAYTWSRAMNMTDEDGWAGMRYFHWEPVIRRNYTAAGYDRRHMFTMAFVWEVPAGKGKKLNIDNRLLNWVAGGWSLASVFSAYTGTPFSVSGTGASLNAPGNSQTADLIAPVRKIGNFGPGEFYYDPMSFRDPNFNRPANVYRFGTMGPNSLYGPGFWRDDANVSKSFAVTERVKTEFRAEVFNLTNTIRWSNPNAGSASMQLNADGTLRNANNFMSITGTPSGYERQFRFALRLAF